MALVLFHAHSPPPRTSRGLLTIERHQAARIHVLGCLSQYCFDTSDLCFRQSASNWTSAAGALWDEHAAPVLRREIGPVVLGSETLKPSSIARSVFSRDTCRLLALCQAKTVPLGIDA